jgi:hypothetical protein
MTPLTPARDTPAGQEYDELRTLARREGRDHAEIDVLRSRIAKLERELEEARSEFRELERARLAPGEIPVAAPARGGPLLMVTAASSSVEKLALFRARFVGRSDVHTVRWTSVRTESRGGVPRYAVGFTPDTRQPRTICRLKNESSSGTFEVLLNLESASSTLDFTRCLRAISVVSWSATSTAYSGVTTLKHSLLSVSVPGSTCSRRCHDQVRVRN